MRKLATACLVLAIAGCYPAGRGQELETRVDKLAADDKDLANQLAQEREDLKKQAGDLQAKLDDVSTRLAKIEQDAHTGAADQGVQIAAAREDVAQLRGALEEYQHRIEQLEQGQKALSDRTDQTAAAAKGQDAVRDLQARKSADALARPKDKAEFLKLADDRAAAGDSDVAKQLYDEWLGKWPRDPLAASAHYSLGKLQQDAHHEREALSEFGEVAKNFPKSPQAAPALLRSSECFAALKMDDASRLALQALVKDYPRSQEGKIAAERLKKAPKKKAK